MLELSHVNCGYHGIPVLKDISFSVSKGDVVCVLGQNGIGKTTLYRTLLGILPALAGSILVGGQPLHTLPRSTVAKHISYVPQSHKAVHPYSVLDVVTMGRTAHLAWFKSPCENETALALKALRMLKIEHLTHRVFAMLSGGERQLVYIARALAQNAGLLLMDEPTANLDLGRRMMILEQIRALAKQDRAILFSTHTPDDAFACANKVIALLGHDRYAVGKPSEVITEALLKEMYAVDVEIQDISTRAGDARICLPVGI